MKLFFTVILLFISQNLFSQNKKIDSTHKIPFDTNKIKEAVRLSNTSEVFSYDSLYIWSDKRSLSEIMDERPGYFIYDFGLGERNDINYNSRYSRETGIFRDGIQINDNFFQGFDIQNISVNEIDRIEEVSNTSSFFYGINSFAKSINVITKDFFQPLPFSQFRFSQDRYGSVFADVIYNQAFSRKMNVQLGITKHSLDGRYQNSAFDIWRGRARLNLYFSPKFNAKLNFYLNNYDRGLNDGLVYSPNENNLTDPELATVIHPSTIENLENYYYDITMTSRFFKNPNSLTKLKIYSMNSLRELNNSDTVFYIGNLPAGYNHALLYAIDLKQNVLINHNKNSFSDLLLGGSVYINMSDGSFYERYRDNYYSLFGKYDFEYKSFFISGLLRNDNIQNENFLNYGIESFYYLVKNKNFAIKINGGLNQTKYLLLNALVPRAVYDSSALLNYDAHYYEIGAKISYNNLTLSALLFGYNGNNDDSTGWGNNINLDYVSKYLDINLNYNYNFDIIFPQNYLKSNIAFKDILFNNRLKLKIGFDMKFYNINYITRQFQSYYSFYQTRNSFPQKNQFIADFYIGARIGRANVNLTVANIFNSLVYNTYVFPLDNLGGFLNFISRFTIVWDFIN